MAASELERTPLDFAREMRSVCVRAIGKRKGKINLLVMDRHNCNEVIAFITYDSGTGKLHCSDRDDRAIFTADCGVSIFKPGNEIIFWTNQSEENLFPSWKVTYVNENTFRCIAQKSPFSKDDPSRQCKTEFYDIQLILQQVYTVTNELPEEVCIMRCGRMVIDITYFKSMDDGAKLLLLAFSTKRLFIDFRLDGITFPNIVVSRKPPRSIRQDEKGSTMAEGVEVRHSSINLTAVVDVKFHKAGYNKALGMQYYDVVDRNTGMTLLTFEVSVEDNHNVTAILKDGNGITIMTASKLVRDLTIKLEFEETFTFATFKQFNALHPRFYDSDGNMFLEVRKTGSSKPGAQFRRKSTKYSFFNSEHTEDSETPQATVTRRGPNNSYAIFHNQKLDGRSKAIILAYALRSTLLAYNSHTIPIPPIGYCYNGRS